VRAPAHPRYPGLNGRKTVVVVVVVVVEHLHSHSHSHRQTDRHTDRQTPIITIPLNVVGGTGAEVIVLGTTFIVLLL